MKNFPDKLKLARQAAGLTQAAVAEQLGMTKQAYGKYERGLVRPNSARLLEFSALLKREPRFFAEPIRVDYESFSFRKKAKLTGMRLHRLRADVVDKIDRALTLEEILGLDAQLDRTVLTDERAPFKIVDSQIDRAADDLRSKWNIGQDPIASLRDILREKGVRIIEFSLDADFDGLCSVVEDKVSLIVTNRHARYDAVRQRFNLAHELGHLLLNIDDSVPPAIEEKICHRFASALLLPPAALKAELGGSRSGISLTELKSIRQKWGISGAAVIYRAKDARLIPESFANRYWKLRRSNDRIKFEIGWGDFPSEHRDDDYLKLLGTRALQLDLLSYSRAAELLECSISEAKALTLDPMSIHEHA